MTVYRNNKQNAALHGLVGELNIDSEQKEELVYQYTNGRTTSSSKMLIDECQMLINYLNSIKRGMTPKPDAWKEDPANVMRRKLLAICHELHWTVNGKVDLVRLDDWLKKSGLHHKKLKDLTIEELPAQITQLEQVLKSFYAKR